MPILDEHHDFAHPVEGDTAWSESYYFNAYCPVADAGIFTRIGVRPNEGTMDVGLSVWLPGSDFAHVVKVREQREMVDVGLGAGGVRHQLVDARGNRDKSWGPRRWGGPKMWRWFSINIDDETHFGGIRIGTEAGDLHRGWVWTEGEHSSIKEWKVTSEVAGDGVTHTATHVHATDKQGRVHELDADVFRVSPGPAGVRPDSTIVNEGLARWTYEGRTGYGISEYLHQLDARARPVVPIE